MPSEEFKDQPPIIYKTRQELVEIARKTANFADQDAEIENLPPALQESVAFWKDGIAKFPNKRTYEIRKTLDIIVDFLSARLRDKKMAIDVETEEGAEEKEREEKQQEITKAVFQSPKRNTKRKVYAAAVDQKEEEKINDVLKTFRKNGFLRMQLIKLDSDKNLPDLIIFINILVRHVANLCNSTLTADEIMDNLSVFTLLPEEEFNCLAGSIERLSDCVKEFKSNRLSAGEKPYSQSYDDAANKYVSSIIRFFPIGNQTHIRYVPAYLLDPSLDDNKKTGMLSSKYLPAKESWKIYQDFPNNMNRLLSRTREEKIRIVAEKLPALQEKTVFQDNKKRSISSYNQGLELLETLDIKNAEDLEQLITAEGNWKSEEDLKLILSQIVPQYQLENFTDRPLPESLFSKEAVILIVDLLRDPNVNNQEAGSVALRLIGDESQTGNSLPQFSKIIERIGNKSFPDNANDDPEFNSFVAGIEFLKTNLASNRNIKYLLRQHNPDRQPPFASTLLLDKLENNAPFYLIQKQLEEKTKGYLEIFGRNLSKIIHNPQWPKMLDIVLKNNSQNPQKAKQLQDIFSTLTYLFANLRDIEAIRFLYQKHQEYPGLEIENYIIKTLKDNNEMVRDLAIYDADILLSIAEIFSNGDRNKISVSLRNMLCTNTNDKNEYRLIPLKNGNTLLHELIAYQDVRNLQKLAKIITRFLPAESVVIINQEDDNFLSPISLAAKNGDLEIVKILLGEGAEAENTEPEDVQFYPLYVAAENGQLKIVKFLIEKGLSVNLPNTEGINPLYIAILNGHEEVANFLVKSKESFCEDEEDGCCSILCYAAENGHENVVRFLVENGAKINYVSRYGTPIDFARNNDHEEIAKYLEEELAKIPNPSFCPFLAEQFDLSISQDQAR
jgi:ankyrin repeat protein